MSYNPNPCYCEQACEYEDLLILTLEFFSKMGLNEKERKFIFRNNPKLSSLREDIQQTIKKYEQAQKEYADECFKHHGKE